MISVISLFSCQKKEVGNKLPQCIEEILEMDQNTMYSPILRVNAQIVGGEQHYWLNTDERHADGPEYILNEICDTVCYLCGECTYPSCLDNYKDENWETIWER